jgi:hypothetical protein
MEQIIDFDVGSGLAGKFSEFFPLQGWRSARTAGVSLVLAS